MPITNYNLRLTGYVGGYDFDRQYVEYVLEQNKDKSVNVLIDSLGGSLATALSIAAAFHNHGDVSVHFVGMNASAATIASLGAKHVSMDQSAMYLAHKCSTSFFEWGSMNSDQLQDLQEEISQMQSDLDKMDANVAQMYASKCGKKFKDILDLMKVGGWLSAEEAKDWGFVDEITSWEEEKGSTSVLDDTTVSAMTAAGIPIPKSAGDNTGSSFGRFIAALTAFFKQRTPEGGESVMASEGKRKESENSDNKDHNNIMKKIFALLGAVLKVEDFTIEDGKAVLTENQMQAIEDAFAEKDSVIASQSADVEKKDSEIASLKSEIEALKKAPAAGTTQVVDAGGHGAGGEKNEAEMYVETLNSARTLYNDLP